MALYIVRKRNPYYPVGTWIECFEQGCRRVRVETVNRQLEVVADEGLLLPEKDLRPFMIKPMKRGLDKWHDR